MEVVEKLYGCPSLPFENFASPMGLASARLHQAFENGERDPIGFHDEISVLSALFLLVVTGVRFTRSPFAFLPRLVSEDISIMYAEDKVVSSFHARRVVALPTYAEEILILYAQHLRNLVFKLARKPIENIELASKIQALITPGLSREQQIVPYFFLLDGAHHFLPLRKKSIKKQLGELLDFRLQEFRPQLCQFLINIGAPRHLVAFQMGHMKAMRPAFSRQNQMTLLEFGLYMQPFLDLYVQKLGWNHG